MRHLFRIVLPTLLVLASCRLDESAAMIKLDGFPWSSFVYRLEVVFWDEGDFIESVSFGDELIRDAMIDGPYTTILEAPSHYTDISFFLWPNNLSSNSKPVYFMQMESTPDHRYWNSWWLDYDQYFESDVIAFGKSRQFAEDFHFGDSCSGAFEEQPYRIFSIQDVLDSSFSVLIDSSGENLDAAYTSYFSSVNNPSTRLEVNFANVVEDFTANGMFIILEPEDYGAEADFDLSILDRESEGYYFDMRFRYDFVVLGSDECLYFKPDNENILRRVDYENRQIDDVLSFDSSYSMHLSSDGEAIFIAQPTTLWVYWIDDQRLEEVYAATFSGTVYVPYLYMAGENPVFMQRGRIGSSSWHQLTLFDYPEMDILFQGERESVGGPTLGDARYYDRNEETGENLFLVKPYTGDNIVESQQIGSDPPSIGPWVIREDEEEGLRAPLTLFPDGSRFLEGSGRVFTTDESMDPVYDIDFPHSDAAFVDGRILLLGSDLVALDPSDDMRIETVMELPEGTFIRRMLVGEEAVVLILQDSYTKITHIMEVEIDSIDAMISAAGGGPSPLSMNENEMQMTEAFNACPR